MQVVDFPKNKFGGKYWLVFVVVLLSSAYMWVFAGVTLQAKPADSEFPPLWIVPLVYNLWICPVLFLVVRGLAIFFELSTDARVRFFRSARSVAMWYPFLSYVGLWIAIVVVNQ